MSAQRPPTCASSSTHEIYQEERVLRCTQHSAGQVGSLKPLIAMHVCRQALLNHVLEEGTGCPAALAILYTEICARLGLPLHIHSLDRSDNPQEQQ